MKTNKGFTLIEVLIVVFVIALIAGMTVPVLAKSREKARRVNCAGNMKSIGLALLMYSGENSGFFVLAPDGNSIEPLNTEGVLNNGKVYGCPSVPDLRTMASNMNYIYAASGLKDDHPDPTATVVLYDEFGNHGVNAWMNCLFIDGHVEGAKPDGSKTWNTYPPPRGVQPEEDQE